MKVASGMELPMTLWKNAKTIIQVGHPTSWGRVLDFPVNKDRSRLGFRTHQMTQKPNIADMNKGPIPAIPNTFTSAGHLGDDSIYVTEAESSLP